MAQPRPPRISEKVVQQHVANFFLSIGGRSYQFGHHRSKGRKCPGCHEFVPNLDFSTRQTPGAADVLGFAPHRPSSAWLLVFVECKAEGGRPSPAQLQVRDDCVKAGVHHVFGDLDDVIRWALEQGIVTEGQIPHYRLPKGPEA